MEVKIQINGEIVMSLVDSCDECSAREKERGDLVRENPDDRTSLKWIECLGRLRREYDGNVGFTFVCAEHCNHRGDRKEWASIKRQDQQDRPCIGHCFCERHDFIDPLSEMEAGSLKADSSAYMFKHGASREHAEELVLRNGGDAKLPGLIKLGSRSFAYYDVVNILVDAGTNNASSFFNHPFGIFTCVVW